MNKILFIILNVILLSCGVKEMQKSEISVSENNNQKCRDSLYGYWILADYIDSLKIEKSIAAVRMQKPAWTAIIIFIDKYEIIGHGSIYQRERVRMIKDQNDTIAILDNFGYYYFRWDSINCQLSLVPDVINDDQKVYRYRRLTKDESFLLNDLNEDKGFPIWRNFSSFFSEYFFTGTYREINGSKEMTLTENYTINGFEDFTEYEIEDYFGTSHPYGNYDVIRFENPAKKVQYPNRNFKVFSWKISGDTLMLREMDSYNEEEWFIKGKPLFFIRSAR